MSKNCRVFFFFFLANFDVESVTLSYWQWNQCHRFKWCLQIRAVKFSVFSQDESSCTISLCKPFNTINMISISSVWQPQFILFMRAEAAKNPLIISARVGRPQSSTQVHHTTVTDPCDDSNGLILAWKYGSQPTNNLLSTPAHYGNNYCRNQCAKLQTDTEALLSERERRRPPSPLSGLSASFRGWPLCPLNPSALFLVTNTFLCPLSGCGGQAV